jgi:UDP-GlcNAc:undecaprenyl-phosphate GlcNAc-1-phosphate transferase
MLDGLDGLTGGVALIQISACALLAFLGNQLTETWMLLLLATCLLTFLRYNFPWRDCSLAQIFLGDVGSMFLGFTIAWFAIWIPEQSEYIPPTVMLWILALPIADALQVVTHRAVNRKSPLEPDREHTHHMLMTIGMSKRKTTYTLCGLTILCSFVGLSGEFALSSEKILFLSFISFLMLYCVSMFLLRRYINNEVIPWQE